jgi:hypothetical protein
MRGPWQDATAKPPPPLPRDASLKGACQTARVWQARAAAALNPDARGLPVGRDGSQRRWEATHHRQAYRPTNAQPSTVENQPTTDAPAISSRTLAEGAT